MNRGRNKSLKRKPKLKFPEDCDKLSTKSCNKTEGKCKLQYGGLFFKNKCVENEDYELEKYIFSEEFENSLIIDERNLPEQLRERNKMCNRLDKHHCSQAIGKKLGCKYKNRVFNKGECILDPKVVRYFKKKQDLCDKPCNEIHEKGLTDKCPNCMDEFKEIFNQYKLKYKEISKEGLTKQNFRDFENIYDDMMDEFGRFVYQNSKVLQKVEELRINVQREKGDLVCQAYNVASCKGSDGELKQCKKKGVLYEEGLFCKLHLDCYERKRKNYYEIRDNLEKTCEDGLCYTANKNLKEFYNMIKITTKGESSVIKNDINDIISIIEQLIKISL